MLEGSIDIVLSLQFWLWLYLQIEQETALWGRIQEREDWTPALPRELLCYTKLLTRKRLPFFLIFIFPTAHRVRRQLGFAARGELTGLKHKAVG